MSQIFCEWLSEKTENDDLEEIGAKQITLDIIFAKE